MVHERKSGVNGNSFFTVDGEHAIRVPCLYERVRVMLGGVEMIGYRPIYLQVPSGNAVDYGEVVNGVELNT